MAEACHRAVKVGAFLQLQILDGDVIEQLEAQTGSLMGFRGLVNHRLDKGLVDLVLLTDSVELVCIGVADLMDQLSLVLLGFFLSLLFHKLLSLLLFGLFPGFFLFRVFYSESRIDGFLPLATSGLKVFKFPGIVIHLFLTVAATAIAASRGTRTCRTAVAASCIGIDMLAGLCKATLHILDGLLPCLSRRIVCINGVKLTFIIATLGTVKHFLFLTYTADSSIGSVFTETLAHLTHLVTQSLVTGIRERHVNAVGDNSLTGCITTAECLGDKIRQGNQRDEYNQWKDVLRLFEIDFLHNDIVNRSLSS